MNIKSVCVFLEQREMASIHFYRKFFTGMAVSYNYEQVILTQMIVNACKKAQTNLVVCSQLAVLKLILRHYDPTATASLETYKGSIFNLAELKMCQEPIEVLIVPSPKFLYSPKQQFITGRWIYKLISPHAFTFPALDWQEITDSNFKYFEKLASEAVMIGVDIETAKRPVKPEIVKSTNPDYKGIWVYMKKGSGDKAKYIPVSPVMTKLCYAMLVRDDKSPIGLRCETGVLQIKSMEDIYKMRALNQSQAPKVMQNGGYDSTYFLRYNAPLHNYVLDTYGAMHAWMVELPRDLAFITSLFDRRYVYWKSEAEFQPLQYNAKDGHNTVWSMYQILRMWPKWAQSNYAENFRYVFPCIHMGAEGWAVDTQERDLLMHEAVGKLKDIGNSLATIVAPNFNPRSSQQVGILMKALGYTGAKSTDEKALKKFGEAHKLYEIIAQKILDYRQTAKAISTYYKATLFNDRLLYELNPFGTDSCRFASKASNLWCGTQIQNIPLYSKKMFIPDEGYLLGSCDAKQSESRTTAYISEDLNLIAAVESPRDFHRTNVTAFFGIPYEQITDEVRNIGKRVNHGANYNMQAFMLLQTMGTKHVIAARRLLGLPPTMSLIDVCAYLLSCFDAAYPNIRGKYYDEVRVEVKSTGMLTSPFGYVRRCFGDPVNVRADLNSYVAHGPQHLSVMIINRALFDIWLYQLETSKLRLKAQVHDDIIWQSKPEDMQEVGEFISKRMSEPVTVRGRTFSIPNDPVLGKPSWRACK